MNHEQVATEFYNDLAIIKETTLKRLSLEYIRERKKLSVHPGNDYPKVYSIRTKAKNNWLIFMRKTPSAEKLSHMADIAFCCVVYYQDKVGLVALRTFEKPI